MANVSANVLARKAPGCGGGDGKGQRFWDDMIPDVLSEVFSRLDMDGLVAVQAVCRAWRGAALQPHCWDSVHLELHGRFLDAFIKEEKGEEDALCCYNRERMNRRAWCIVRRSGSRAKSVCLESVASEEAVREIAQRCPSLESLALHDCRDLPESALIDLARSCTRLRLLSLRGCDAAASVSFIHELGRTCPDLVGLNLSSVSVPDDTAAAIHESLPGLRYLNLSRTDVSDDGVLGILGACSGLVYFDLRCCPALDAYRVTVVDAKAGGRDRDVRCGVSVEEAVERDWGWGYGSWYP